MRRDSGPSGEVALLHCALDADRDIDLAAAWQLLSGDELTRARRFVFPRDRDRFVRGRGFLRQSLGAATGADPARLEILQGPMGKPRLAGGGIDFNLSHSAGLAVLALSRSGPVGIDIEALDSAADLAALAEACFPGEEAEVLGALDGDAFRIRFFQFWTAKEARMKLTGEGMALEPKAIRLLLNDGLPAGCRAPAAPEVRFVYPRLRDTGFICCLATIPKRQRKRGPGQKTPV